MSTSNHLVIFTPYALTVGTGVPPPPNDISEAFAQRLAAKAQAELGLFSVATKSTGGKDLDATFDNFVQALGLSDCAIFVIPGSNVCLLDTFYPRLLVLLTMQPWWVKKMLLVCLGEVTANGKKFDPLIFQHTPVFFSASPSSWDEEKDQWKDVLDFIKLALSTGKDGGKPAAPESANGVADDKENESEPSKETDHLSTSENTTQKEREPEELNHDSHPKDTAENLESVKSEKSEQANGESNQVNQPCPSEERAEPPSESSKSLTEELLSAETSGPREFKKTDGCEETAEDTVSANHEGANNLKVCDSPAEKSETTGYSWTTITVATLAAVAIAVIFPLVKAQVRP